VARAKDNEREAGSSRPDREKRLVGPRPQHVSFLGETAGTSQGNTPNPHRNKKKEGRAARRREASRRSPGQGLLLGKKVSLRRRLNKKTTKKKPPGDKIRRGVRNRVGSKDHTRNGRAARNWKTSGKEEGSVL